MAVVPLNEHIMVKREEPEETSAGGILLPDSAKRRPSRGRVVSLGDGKRLENGERASFQVREGDRVVFSSYSGQEIDCHGQEYLILTEDDILAIVD